MQDHFHAHFIEKGSGEALILLHGNGEDHTYFSRQIDAFAAHFHVFALDTRGHGASMRGEAPFTLSQFADDLSHFMDEQGLARAHILGFSDGGNIALLFALRHPARVASLILNGANLRPGGVKLHIQLPIVIGFCITALFSSKSPQARQHHELLSLMVTQPHIRLDELAALQMPVLVLAGTRDMIRTRHTKKIAAALPNARLRLLSGTHFIAAQNSEAYNEAVLSFLLSCGVQKSGNP